MQLKLPPLKTTQITTWPWGVIGGGGRLNPWVRSPPRVHDRQKKKKMELSDSAGAITTDINIGATSSDIQDGETAPDDESEINQEMAEATVEETAPPRPEGQVMMLYLKLVCH